MEERTLKERFYDGKENSMNTIILRDGRSFTIRHISNTPFNSDLTFPRKTEYDIMIIKDYKGNILYDRDAPVNEFAVELL